MQFEIKRRDWLKQMHTQKCQHRYLALYRSIILIKYRSTKGQNIQYLMFHISRRGNIQIANAKQCYLDYYPSNIQRFNSTKIALPIGLEKVVPEKFKFYMFREYLDICRTNKSLKSPNLCFINILFLNMFGYNINSTDQTKPNRK